MAPLLTVIVFNTVILLLVIRVLVKHNKRKEKENSKSFKNIAKLVVSIASIMTMFGLSWIFAAFSVSSAAIVFQWLFLIFNSSQGLCLFLFFCVISNDGREEWKNLFGYKKSKKKSTYSHHSSSHQSGSHLRGKDFNSSVKSSVTQNTYVVNKPALKFLSVSESASEFESSTYDIELKEKSFEKALPDIPENDTDLIISNEQVDTDNDQEDDISPPDNQLPPHVMIKLRQASQPIGSEPSMKREKKRKRTKRSRSNFAKASERDAQVPPHIIDRFRQPAASFKRFTDEDFSFPDDSFGKSLRGSQVKLTKISEIDEYELM